MLYSDWHLVNSEPIGSHSQQVWHVYINVGDVTHFNSHRIIGVDPNDFPIGLPLINHGQAAKNFDLHNLAATVNMRANINHVHWIAVSLISINWSFRGNLVGKGQYLLGQGVHVVWVFPGLREAPIIPQVAMARKRVGHIPQITALIHVLIEGESRLY